MVEDIREFVGYLERDTRMYPEQFFFDDFISLWSEIVEPMNKLLDQNCLVLEKKEILILSCKKNGCPFQLYFTFKEPFIRLSTIPFTGLNFDSCPWIQWISNIQYMPDCHNIAAHTCI